MKPAVKVVSFGLSGMPAKVATFMVQGGEEITIPLSKIYHLPDGGFNWDKLPALLVMAAARAGYEKLIFELP